MTDQDTAAPPSDGQRVHTLAFFPWLPLDEAFDAGPFELLPYHRGRSPGGPGSPLQETCDGVLEVYRAGPKAPISRATIMTLAEHEVTEHLDDATIHRLLIWGDLVAFACLAARRYFDDFGYANRDAFRLVVQNFDDPTNGVAIQSRRRDGSANAFVTRSAAAFPRPLHVAVGTQATIDGALLLALLARSEQAEWGRYQEGIQIFNAANTDDPAVLEEHEVVAIVGAFERLFDLSRGKEDDLAPKVAEALAAPTSVSPSESPRVLRSSNPAKYTGRPSMREVWIRDLFQLRSQHAHGKIEPQMSTLWTRREHLLLASYAFPLVVKHQLAADGHYTPTDGDRLHVRVFEALLEPVHLQEYDPMQRVSYPWREILNNAQIRAWAEAMYDQLEQDESFSEAAEPGGEDESESEGAPL